MCGVKTKIFSEIGRTTDCFKQTALRTAAAGAFSDSCAVAVLVAGTSKFGILSVENEMGAITRSEKITI